MVNPEVGKLLWYSEPAACLFAVLVICLRKQLSSYRYLAAYLMLRAFSAMLGALLMVGRFVEIHLAYKLYFYLYWGSYASEAVLGFMIVYTVYNLAMEPLKGIQRLGRLMFRWAAGIALAVSLGSALGPHLTQFKFIIKVVTQMQETESILTLCLLLFVAMTAAPMGLSYRSKLFGVSLGLGVIATMNLVGSAWVSQQGDMYGWYTLINDSAIFLSIGVWITYFVKKEPVRRMIVLPTTSPFLRWNQISAVLGDSPGFVVVSEVTSELFAPAEIEVMRRASLKIAPSGIADSHQVELEAAVG